MIRRIVFSSLLLATQAMAAPQGAALYSDHCASCHAETRLGGTGPALIPEALGRIKGEALEEIIAKGRVSTQMPAFGAELTAEEIAALAAYIAEPLDEAPSWAAADIEATRDLKTDYIPAENPVFLPIR